MVTQSPSLNVFSLIFYIPAQKAATKFWTWVHNAELLEILKQHLGHLCHLHLVGWLHHCTLGLTHLVELKLLNSSFSSCLRY